MSNPSTIKDTILRVQEQTNLLIKDVSEMKTKNSNIDNLKSNFSDSVVKNNQNFDTINKRLDVITSQLLTLDQLTKRIDVTQQLLNSLQSKIIEHEKVLNM